MSEPEKYTLPRVLEIVRGHAEALGHAGEALHATEGKDPEVLAMVGKRALRASADLCEINDTVDLSRPVEERPDVLEDAWWGDQRGTTELHRATDTLPLLALATEAAAADPHGALTGAGQRWTWCHRQAEQISDDLMAWVKAHEKDAGPATSPVEEQETTKPESSELLPMDAFDEMAGALRPLVSGLSDFETGWGGYSCFVKEQNDGSELTYEGERRIDEMSSIATKEAQRLVKVETGAVNTYLPHWCGHQLFDVRATVQRIAWILYGATQALHGDPTHERPRWAAVHGYDMAQEAYRGLCDKQDDYQAAEKVAIDNSTKTMVGRRTRTGDGTPHRRLSKR